MNGNKKESDYCVREEDTCEVPNRVKEREKDSLNGVTTRNIIGTEEDMFMP